MVRTSGPADHTAGQNSGADQPGPLSPAFDNNPAVGSTSVIGTGVPVENPNPATIQPTVIAMAAPIATMPILPAPPPRQTNADSALAGASGALIGTPSPAPDAGVAPPGDTGSVGAPPQSFGDALANHVLSMASAGHQETTLQLQPPQLGDLTVRIAVQGRDVSAWFGAAQPQVQQAVGQALDQLRLDLAGAGFNLAGAWVGADTSGTPRQFDTATMPGRRSGFAASAIGRAANDKADSPQRSSGVSIYV
jgi:flagellar hook-length control protein FliK